MDWLYYIDTWEKVLGASAVVLFSLATLARLLLRLTPLTPTKKDDEVLEVVADALEGAAKDVDGVKSK